MKHVYRHHWGFQFIVLTKSEKLCCFAPFYVCTGESKALQYFTLYDAPSHSICSFIQVVFSQWLSALDFCHLRAIYFVSYSCPVICGYFICSKLSTFNFDMPRFLDGTLDVKKTDVLEDPNTSKESKSSVQHMFLSPTSEESVSAKNEQQNEVEKTLNYLSDQIDSAVRKFTEKGEFPSGIELPKASVKIVSQGKRKLLVNGSENLLYSSNIAFQIAASMKRRQLGDKNVHQSKSSRDCAEENELSPKTIAEKLATSLDPVVKNSDMSIRACNGHINFYSPTIQLPLSEGVQNAAAPKKSGLKRDSGGNCLSSPQRCQLKSRRLEIRLKRSNFDPEEYALYRRYQLKVHNDKPEHVTESSYRRFLVDSPLLYVSSIGDGTVPPCGFGSFHQQYLVDGQLVAVGVIDILPKCLSSKYLFWDPDFAFLSLGKYSALQEIGWVKENQVHCPSLQYYYLGYYIHSCNKMRYKAAYYPSELLCPLRYQ